MEVRCFAFMDVAREGVHSAEVPVCVSTDASTANVKNVEVRAFAKTEEFAVYAKIVGVGAFAFMDSARTDVNSVEGRRSVIMASSQDAALNTAQVREGSVPWSSEVYIRNTSCYCLYTFTIDI